MTTARADTSPQASFPDTEAITVAVVTGGTRLPCAAVSPSLTQPAADRYFRTVLARGIRWAAGRDG